MPEMLNLTAGFVNVPGGYSPNDSAGIVSSLSAMDGSALAALAAGSGNFVELNFEPPTSLPALIRLQLQARATYGSGSPSQVVVSLVRDGSSSGVNLSSPAVNIAVSGTYGTYTLDLPINPAAVLAPLDWQIRLSVYVDNTVYVDRLTLEADPEGAGGDTGPGQQRGLNASNFEMYCGL